MAILTNVTVDNVNTTMIHYYPPLCNGTGWQTGSDLAALSVDQTYTYCSGANGARAVFKFIGVAVYFSIPVFPTPETMYFRLDDLAFQEVQIGSPTGARQPSLVVWSATELPNAQHTLEILPGLYDGEPGFVSVDAFIYSESDEPIAAADGASIVPANSGTNAAAIGVGVGLGFVIIALLGVGAFFFLRSRQQTKKGSAPATHYPVTPTAETTFLPPGQINQYDPNFRPASMVAPNNTGPHTTGPGYGSPMAGFPQPGYQPSMLSQGVYQ